MQKIRFSIYFIFISIFTFVTLFILIVQNSYNDLIKPTSHISSSSLSPIDPNLDLSIISQIEKREDFAAENLSTTLIGSESALLTVSASTSSSTINPTPTTKL